MSTTTAPRRGRPRPPAVIARDEEIHQLLTAGPRSRNQIAEETGLEKSIAYLALDRLRRAGRIRQCLQDSVIVWTINDGTPCP